MQIVFWVHAFIFHSMFYRFCFFLEPLILDCHNITLNFAVCFLLVVSVRCRRRWRNHVPLWGRFSKFTIYLLFLSNVSSIYCMYLQNGAEMGSSYDYKKCIGLKIMPRQGDGLLFYSVFPNGTIDPVIYFILSWIKFPMLIQLVFLAYILFEGGGSN